MKVSVITITYNCEATIENTILSVINQDYCNLEYIIVDGASTDNTLSIVSKYKNRISKIISEPDQGISDGFNKGIKIASGEIIALINSDDTLLENAISQVVDNIQPGIDVFFGNGIRIYLKGSQKPYLANPDPLSLKKGMTLVHPATFISAEAYKKFGVFNIEYKCVMDRELLLRMLNGGAKFQYSNDFYATYAMGGLSDKQYFKHCLPEDYKISIENGLSILEAKRIYIKNYIMFVLIKIRNKIRRLD